MTGEISALPDRELTVEEVLALASGEEIVAAEPRRVCGCGVTAVDVFLEDRMVRLEYRDGQWVRVGA